MLGKLMDTSTQPIGNIVYYLKTYRLQGSVHSLAGKSSLVSASIVIRNSLLSWVLKYIKLEM
jgi:hypothetical protein